MSHCMHEYVEVHVYMRVVSLINTDACLQSQNTDLLKMNIFIHRLYAYGLFLKL